MTESPPQVNAFLLCDQAFQQAYSGKWCVIGTFSAITARQFPVTHAPLVVFVGLSDFTGSAPVQVQILKDDGTRVAAVKADVPPLPVSATEFALPFPPVRFEEPGTYTMELSASDNLLAVRSFRVDLFQQPPPGQQGQQPQGPPPWMPGGRQG